MGKKAKSNAGKKKAQDRKIDKSTLPPPPPRPEDEVCVVVDVFLLQVLVLMGCCCIVFANCWVFAIPFCFVY